MRTSCCRSAAGVWDRVTRGPTHSSDRLGKRTEQRDLNVSQFTQTEGERLPSEREVRYTYEVSPHYDLFGTFRFARFGQWDPTQTLSSHRLVKAFRFEDNPCVLDAQLMDGRLDVHLRASGVLPTDDHVTRLFGLIVHRCSGRAPVSPAHKSRKKGIHLGQSTHLGMDLITTFQQLIEWRDAAAIWRRWISRPAPESPAQICSARPPIRGESPHARPLAWVRFVEEAGRFGVRLPA